MSSVVSLRLALRVAFALVGVSSSAWAQQPPTNSQQAAPTTTGSSIRRDTNRVTNVGDFGDGTAPAPAPRPNGDIGTTGSVAERGPSGDLRGNVGPAPGEIDMSRPIGPGDVARIVRSQEPRFRPCYDRARATRPTLAGRVNMRFTINRDGRLTHVEVDGIPEAPEVSTCIREQLTQTLFPRPESGVLPFVYAMNFAPPPPPARGRGNRNPRVNTVSRRGR